MLTDTEENEKNCMAPLQCNLLNLASRWRQVTVLTSEQFNHSLNRLVQKH